MVSSAQNPKNYLSFNFFAFSSYQDKQLFTNKRWIHYDVPICSRELKNRNFLVTFEAIFVAITELVTFGFRIIFFSELFQQPCSIGLSATEAYFNCISYQGQVVRFVAIFFASLAHHVV